MINDNNTDIPVSYIRISAMIHKTHVGSYSRCLVYILFYVLADSGQRKTWPLSDKEQNDISNGGFS